MEMHDAVSPRPGILDRCYWLWRMVIFLTPTVAVHLALLALPFVEVTLWSIVQVFIMTRIIGLGVTVGHHRYFSHHSFKTSRPFQFVMATIGCTALQRGPLWWAYHHRLHHRHSDTDLDPHSPVAKNFLYGHMTWLCEKDLLDPDYSLVKDLTRYPELVWLDRLQVVPAILLAALCYACWGMTGLIVVYCASVVLVFQVAYSVNSIGHLWGSQRFNTGEGCRNNPVLGILAMGDGWHNNHHHHPSSARHGFAWYEFDLSYQFIRLLAFLGLVWDVKQPPNFALAGAATPPDVCEDDDLFAAAVTH